MRFRDFKIPLSENESDPELEKLRAVISAKIKQLPETDQTYKTLKEIEDLLQNINAGGRLGLINNLMSEIPDSSVKQAQKELARYIAGINMSPKDRDELFQLWKSDNLINHKLLLSPGRHAFSDIVNSYNTNPAIKELTDDLMRVEAYGHGKGEFILNVFSKKIGKPETNKGDLIIDGKSIEVKTTDAGGARFGDQEVRPGDDFFDAVSNFRNTILKPIGYTGAAKSGINVNTIQKLYQDYKDKKKFQTAITPVVKGLFPAANVSECLRALFSGDYNTVRQAFAIASLENYLKQKKDYGVLYVDISKDPSIFIFFRNNEELNQAGFRLDISTQYLVTTDTQRVAAQFTIVPSNRLATQQLQQIVPQGTSVQSTNPKIADWVNRLATNRSITDPNVINQITKLTTNYLEQGYEVEQIIPALEKQFPQLKVVKRSSKKTVKNTAQSTQTNPQVPAAYPV
jgi:hypothetical protein